MCCLQLRFYVLAYKVNILELDVPGPEKRGL